MASNKVILKEVKDVGTGHGLVAGVCDREQGHAIEKKPQLFPPRAKDLSNKKGSASKPLSTSEWAKNRTKSRVRAKVERPILVLKRVFGFDEVRYRGL